MGGGCDSNMGVKEIFSGKKLHLSLDLASLGRMTEGAELREVRRAKTELEISRNYYDSLGKQLEWWRLIVMKRGSWIQDVFGDETVCTSDKLDVGMNHMDSDARSSEFKFLFHC